MSRRRKNNPIPKKKKPFFFLVRWVVKLIFRKPKIINFNNEELDPRSIIISNHAKKTGPVILKLYYPIFFCFWGAHEMLGTFKERFHYLRDIFYMQKQGYNKFVATIRGGFEAIFSYEFYKAMKVIPSYQDARLIDTVNYSIELLEHDIAVLVFPENSNDGYKEVLEEFFPGFVLLSDKYYKKNHVDLPIYPTYFDKKRNIVYIGKKVYMQDYVKLGYDKKQIAEEFRSLVNKLYLDSLEK
ncbi:MAG: hypothetical protein PUA56_02635 [Bacillales bacterium]|nr:hypothetical protein [Bacillales bacterium]